MTAIVGLDHVQVSRPAASQDTLRQLYGHGARRVRSWWRRWACGSGAIEAHRFVDKGRKKGNVKPNS
jgi:hypothetical protein